MSCKNNVWVINGRCNIVDDSCILDLDDVKVVMVCYFIVCVFVMI